MVGSETIPGRESIITPNIITRVTAALQNRRQPCVRVVVNFYAGPDMGRQGELLDVLAAAKLCAERPAWPADGPRVSAVCRLRPAPFSSDFSPAAFPAAATPPDRADAPRLLYAGQENTLREPQPQTLFETIAKALPDADEEVFLALRDAFTSNTNWLAAARKWLEWLLRDFAVTVEIGETGETVQTMAPANATANATGTITNEALDETNAANAAEVILPPGCSGQVTIIDRRTEKTLRRYQLDWRQLTDSPETRLRAITTARESLASVAPEQLRTLREETSLALDKLAALDAGNARFAKIRRGRTARVLYQLDKLQRHCHDAAAEKLRVAVSRIDKACLLLTPVNRPQRETLSALHLPLRYGRAGLRGVYEQLDLTGAAPQLIVLD